MYSDKEYVYIFIYVYIYLSETHTFKLCVYILIYICILYFYVKIRMWYKITFKKKITEPYKRYSQNKIARRKSFWTPIFKNLLELLFPLKVSERTVKK